MPEAAARWPLFRPLDILVAAAILAGVLPTLPLLAAPAGSRAEVYVENRKVARLTLEGPARRMAVPTALGPVVLEYGQGNVRVAQAPCPNHLCVKSGPVSRSGAVLLCLPCRLKVEVEGGGRGPAGKLDAVTY